MQDALARMLLEGKLTPGAALEVDVAPDGGELAFRTLSNEEFEERNQKPAPAELAAGSVH